MKNLLKIVVAIGATFKARKDRKAKTYFLQTKDKYISIACGKDTASVLIVSVEGIQPYVLPRLK